MGTAGILCFWALQGYLGVGHCRDTLRLGTSVKHCRDTHWLSTAGIITWWLGTGDTWWLVTKVSFQSGEDNIYFKISQPHCEGGQKKRPRPNSQKKTTPPFSAMSPRQNLIFSKNARALRVSPGKPRRGPNNYKKQASAQTALFERAFFCCLGGLVRRRFFLLFGRGVFILLLFGGGAV